MASNAGVYDAGEHFCNKCMENMRDAYHLNMVPCYLVEGIVVNPTIEQSCGHVVKITNNSQWLCAKHLAAME